MGKHYFVSDLHLGFRLDEYEKKKRDSFNSFLKHVGERGDSLWLLGDIFDFWFEWHHVIPKYWFSTLSMFNELVEKGVEVTFITGNHDFHIGSFLEQEVGLICRDSDCSTEIEGKRFFMGHGDGYAASDKGYRLLKKIIRNRVSKALFRNLIPADAGMWLAERTSGTSRKVMAKPVEEWREEYYQFACARFKEGFDFVLLGHIHYPELRESESGVYMNCGDWLQHRSYGVYESGELTMNYWKGSPDSG